MNEIYKAKHKMRTQKLEITWMFENKEIASSLPHIWYSHLLSNSREQ